MEDDNPQKRAFDLSELPETVDLSVPPVSGMDYLYRVRLEARSCPQVVVAKVDRTRFLSRQTVTVDISNGFVRAKPGFEPEPNLQKEQLESFKELRKQVSELREILMEKFPRKEFPNNSDPHEWSLFCLGPELHERLREDSNEEGTPSPSKRQRIHHQQSGNSPLLSIVLHLTQARVARLLTLHTQWLDKLGMHRLLGEWIYALLACLETPLNPDVCSQLRVLARTCSRSRDTLISANDSRLRPLNLIMSIIAHSFGQKDMHDDYEIES